MSRILNFPFFVFGLCAVLSSWFIGCNKAKATADLILTNGKIVTVDATVPEAEALAVKGDEILAVGNAEEIDGYKGHTTRMIDLKGKLAIPGFIDSHLHFTSIGRARLSLDLTKVRNWDEIVAVVAEAVRKSQPGEWILGRGWHQEKWDRPPNPNSDGLPLHHGLSKISPDNPVLLSHASGHSAIANARAMELAGITGETQAPPGGEIVKDEKGRPIGAFRETAQGALWKAYDDYHEKMTPAQKDLERRKIVELADKECLSKGLTSVHDAGSSFETIDLFKDFVEKGKLGVRLYVMIAEGNAALKKKISEYRILGLGKNHLTVRSVKRLIDGALGPHGAWLLKPYTDLPSSTGLNTTPVAIIRETAEIAITNDFQLCVHAIGDRANREVLNIFEDAFETHPDKKDLRWRGEHCQHLHPSDIPRFGRLGVIASMQGIHCTSDGPWVWKRLGEKRAVEGAYVWKKLMEAGAVICNGTDAPVEDADPIPCFYATVSRKLKDGRVFYPDQRMSRLEALRSYTINGAYAAFQEDMIGSLVPGKLADIVVLSRDILTIPEEEIMGTEVVCTIVGGKVLYKQ